MIARANWDETLVVGEIDNKQPVIMRSEAPKSGYCWWDLPSRGEGQTVARGATFGHNHCGIHQRRRVDR